MRIAHVANFYGPTSGGLRTTVHALGRGYRERGHQFLMIVPGISDRHELTEFGHRVTVRSPIIPMTGGYRVISRGGAVRRALARFAPDVLEVSDRTTLRGLGNWARASDIPSVFFAHERADGVISANVPSLLRRARPITALSDWHNRGTHRRFTTIVCTTDFAGEEFSRIGVATRKVPLGVDLDVFIPSRFDAHLRNSLVAPNTALILMASRLSAEKRPDLAIDAVRLLASQGRAVRLVCVGTGALEAQMRVLAEDAPADFLGFVSDRDHFASLLATADVVVAPGPIETFGLAALESLACGTPVIFNRHSALSEVVGDAGVAAAGTAEGFATALAQMLDTDAHDRRDKARTRAESMPWSATVDALIDIHHDSLRHTRALSRET